MGLTRRTLIGGLAATAVVATGVYLGTSGAQTSAVTLMRPDEVLASLRAGEVLLVDIRRPDEWARTGIAQGAVPIDMRRPDFVQALAAARSSDQQPVVLICARGFRSKRLAAELDEAGISPVIDVPEGMLGSFSGPGWVQRGLPIDPWEA